MNLFGVTYCALRNVQQFSGARLRDRQICRSISALTVAKIRNLGCDHSSLAFVQVPSSQIQRDNVGKRIIAALA